MHVHSVSLITTLAAAFGLALVLGFIAVRLRLPALVGYLRLFAFDLPLKLSGTHHQIAVWEAMMAIPAGETRTYGELAQAIGSSARAVGGACGANPIPIVVPCHRVVGAGGALGGFMGAREEGFELSIKRWLLAHEGARRG